MPIVVLPSKPTVLEIPQQCKEDCQEYLDKYPELEHATTPMWKKIYTQMKTLAEAE